MLPHYVEVALAIPADRVEEIVAVLGMLGFQGFWEESGELLCYIPAGEWSAGKEDELRNAVRILELPDAFLRITDLAPRDWNEEWERSIGPVRISDRLTVRPSWTTPPDDSGDLDVVIDPKMSFGTGYHETTRLILRMLEGIVGGGERVLDVGCGTGILAIAAIKFGASSAVAVDVDPWAYHNAMENAAVNGVGDTIMICQGSLEAVPPGAFDIVLSNIQRTVLLDLLPEIVARTKPNGVVLLAGLLSDEEGVMRAAAASAGLAVEASPVEGEWLALACRRISTCRPDPDENRLD